MRSYRGEHIYPMVEPTHTFMPTNYGGRERPDLKVKGWVRFGEGGNLVLPAPNKPVLTGSATVTAATSHPLGMQPVEKLTAKEVTGDEIKY